MSPTLPWRALGALLAACLGASLWWAVAGALPQADRDVWDERPSSVPIETPWLASPLGETPSTMDLWFYRAISPRNLDFHDGEIHIRARVPEGGQLRLRFGSALSKAGPAAPVEGGVPPRPPPVSSTGQAGVAPPPRQEGAEPGANPGLTIEALSQGASILVDRARGRVAGLNGLECSSTAAPDEHLELLIRTSGDSVEVLDGDQLLATCAGERPSGPLVLSAGVRRVRVHSFGVNDWTWGFAAGLRHPAAALPFVLILGALGAFLGRDRRVLAWLPLALGPLLMSVDARALLDRLRITELASTTGPLLLSLLLANLSSLVAWAKGPWPRHAALAVGLASTGLLAGLGSEGPLDWLTVGLPLLPWAALAWANRNPTRWRVPLSYGLFVLVLVAGEIAIRTSPLHAGWHMSEGLSRASVEFEELLELQRYRNYPTEGFPVRPPERSAKPRVVALGGSSTGGAFQMDDIQQFWPKKLEDRLPDDWEVVNQGVGGWNSLHVRLYLESQIDKLQPDILAVYVGHNDVMSSSTMPYSELYRRYQSGRGSSPGLLSRSELYLGFRFTVLALAPSRQAIAVPVPDARDNLSAIFDAAEAHDARVLLMTEGINPDVSPLESYARMQRELAEERGGLYIDAAGFLQEQGDPDLFLDACHLSRSGHELLAERIAQELRAAGWVNR